MMETAGFAVIAVGVVLFAIVSRRLEGTVVTPPMMFTLFGLAIGPAVLGLLKVDFGHSFIHGMAEVTLILVLFSDAARIDLRQLWRDHNLPLRMLLIGLPLTFAYAILSLTIIRMLPVAVSLIGSGVSGSTVAFLGWFGPRGLASILFALLVVDQVMTKAAEPILVITIVTVTASILAHGLTAAPLAARYGRLTEQMGPCEETKPVSEMPTRTRVRMVAE